MKKQKLTGRIAAVLCLLSVLLSVVSCTDGLVSLEYADDRFVNRGKGLSYIAAPVSYEPAVIGEAYAYCESAALTLYKVDENDPPHYLSTENAGELTAVFYSDALELPALAAFQANVIRVCTSDYYTFEVVCIDDADFVERVVTLFETGEEASLPAGDSLLHYDMKFASDTWTEFYINLNYYEFASGNYLYNRGTRQCVEVGDLFEEILHGGEE